MMNRPVDRPKPTQVDDYMPYPFTAKSQGVLQWVQVFAPMVGTAAAIAHTYYYGHTLGTLTAMLLVGTLTALGVTVGFHRLFTHRSFETTVGVRNALAVLGSMSAQHHLFLWVATHRRHHQFSDDHGDPHSPNLSNGTPAGHIRAFLHAHIGSVLTERLTEEHLSYVADLAADRTLCRIQRLYLVWVGLGLVIPAVACYAIAGTLQAAIGGCLWGGFARMFISTQVTYAVNSICHIWGQRPFESDDMSTNNAVVAALSLGEGWHNNHHAFPTSARHGLLQGQFDASYQFILLLRKLGLAWNVKTPSPAQIDAKLRDADKTDPKSLKAA